jgi:formylglycine-generating enzyme required for sulfatase activity
MYFDAALPFGAASKYIVFGGINSSGAPTADTWHYDGTSWDLRNTFGVRPQARSGHAMVANPRAQNMLMFGGRDGTLALSETWEYWPLTDRWAQRTPTVPQPSGRYGHCMAFWPGANPGDERIFMFGGSPFLSDLWKYDPNSNVWQQVAVAGQAAPLGRRNSAMAYVDGQGVLLLFGGLTQSGVVGDTWFYDPVGNSWQQQALSSSPPARHGHAVSVDTTGNNLVLVGGADGAGNPLDGTWVWSSIPPGNWSEQLPVPKARMSPALAFDATPTRNRVVAFGGKSVQTGADIDETWELDGSNWRRRSPSVRPSPRSGAAMAFDSARGKVVLYGGRSQALGELGDTWEWNGATWSNQFLVPSPPPASGSQIVYDSGRSRIVGLFQGQVWHLDASGWQQAVSDIQPPARYHYGMAYDARRDQLVVFGGMDTLDRATARYNNEIWTFDGVSWVRRFGVAMPAPRAFCQLAYDGSRSRVVMHGGADANFVFEDTWEWDGARWIQESPVVNPTNPAGLHGNAVCFDRGRDLTVLFGSVGTWDYGPVHPSPRLLSASGCATSAGGPLALKLSEWSRLWLGDRLEVEFANQPIGLGLMLWGFSDQLLANSLIPLPLDLHQMGIGAIGCSLHTSADITEAFLPGSGRYVSFPMPVDPYLLSLTIYFQAAFLDAGLAGSPVVTSNLMQMKLGSRGSNPPLPFAPNPALGMVRIGAGNFTMGSSASSGPPYFAQLNESPVHTVSFARPFWMARHEVTQAQYQAMMGSNPSTHQGASYPFSASMPVENVSWNDAMAFCVAVNIQEAAAGRVPQGYEYRLPTEAEWEYCCRAGSTSEFGVGPALLCSHAVMGVSVHSGQNCGAQSPASVGSRVANSVGLYDMHGNVWEWCRDAWDGTANYPATPQSDPLVTVGAYRVCRGGSWNGQSSFCRSAIRNGGLPDSFNHGLGFRIVLAPAVVGP